MKWYIDIRVPKNSLWPCSTAYVVYQRNYHIIIWSPVAISFDLLNPKTEVILWSYTIFYGTLKVRSSRLLLIRTARASVNMCMSHKPSGCNNYVPMNPYNRPVIIFKTRFHYYILFRSVSNEWIWYDTSFLVLRRFHLYYF